MIGDRAQSLALGPEHPVDWWEDHEHPGGCGTCGGQCDGPDCGFHAAGCVFGGPGAAAYWMIADGCPLWHGEDPASKGIGDR